MGTLFRRVVAGQKDLGNYDLIRSMSTLFRRVVPGGGLLPITVGEAGLPDEPTERECTAVRPQRGRISASMWSTALARALPYNRGCFLPSLPSPETKVLENL